MNQRDPMKKFLTLLSAALLHGLLAIPAIAAPGFTDSVVTFYGEVRQAGGGQTVLLQTGQLEMTFANQSNPANKVTLTTNLRPVGKGNTKLYSYAINVPLAYLPEAPRLGEFLAIGSTATNFKIENITINATAATLPDGSKEFYGLSFASRGMGYRLDLLVAGDSTDSDGDGLPDWWEELHDLDSHLADSGEDPDADGWTNLEEFLQGGDPNVSNRVPQLAAAEIIVPDSGEAGVYLHFLDSDTLPEDMEISVPGSDNEGFSLNLDGTAIAAGETRSLSLAGMQSGRLTLRQVNRSLHGFSLPLTWSDGGEAVSGNVLVSVVSPSTRDGNDSTLWLDGMDLAADGSPISSWTDRSGNSRNATQPLPSQQPLTNDHSADFSKSTNAHLFFQDLAIPNGNHTVLAAYRAAATSDQPQTLLATNRGFLQFASTSQPVSYPGAPTYQMDGVATQGYQNHAGLESTSIFRREGYLLQNVFGLSYDGEDIAAVSLDPVLPTLGGRRSAVPGGPDPLADSFAGQLHELLIFPTALPEQKLRDVNDYLASKWGGSVIWDLSTELKPITLTAASGTRPQIIRGGHGPDRIGGGPLDDTLSGGAGADILTGGGGSNRFVFGGLDTGNDRITDFDAGRDVIDLSAMFWGRTGDARQFISVRLDTNFTTPTPTLDTALLVRRPDGSTQEITLENAVVGSSQLIQLVVEGRIRMGGLSIPSIIQIARAPGSPTGPLTESLDQPFQIVVTRGGAGVAAALDLPLGFFEDAFGGHFVIDGASGNESHRAVVHFPRGVTSRTLTVRPVPDLDTAGTKTIQVAVIPQYKYTVSGGPVQQALIDKPMVWLEVVQPNAISSIAQSARLRVHRDGDSEGSLNIAINLGGTAKEGIHIYQVPDSVTIAAGQEFAEILVSPRPEGLLNGPRAVHFRLETNQNYQLGNPNEAVLYAATTAAEANGAGFDRWLQASTNGVMNTLADLSAMSPDSVSRYLQAYALGLGSADELASHPISFRIVDGKPEILTHGTLKAADVRWAVESASILGQWSDATASFTEAADVTGTKLVGRPLQPNADRGFYRLGLNLEPGQLATDSITALAGTHEFGMSGDATWKTEQASGNLTTDGGIPGGTSRIITKATGATNLDFEMKISGAGLGDEFTFYIDGVMQARTTGDVVSVRQELTGDQARLLMWEFKRGTGKAVIRNLVK